MFADTCDSELTDEERDAIAHYKEYQSQHLPAVTALRDLYASDFIPNNAVNAQDTTNTIDQLKQYIDTLGPYTRHVRRAAYLRQSHFELYINGRREEDPGHTAWREGMNTIAEDCQEKLQYWSRVYEEKLNEVFDAAEKIRSYERPTLRTIDFTTRNCDLSFYKKDKISDKKSQKPRPKVYYPPKVSARERARLNEQYRAQLLEKNRQEHQMLDREMGKVSEYHKLIKSYDSHKIGNAIEVPTLDIYDELVRIGIDDPLTCKKFALEYNCGIIPIGTAEEMVDLSLLLYKSISQINLQFCRYYKCIGVDTVSDLTDDGKNTAVINARLQFVESSHNYANYECSHVCDKCNIGEVIPESLQVYCRLLDHLVHLINYIIQLNPQADIVILTLLNCLLTDSRAAWNSYVSRIVTSMILAQMDEDAIIANIRAGAEKLIKLRDTATKVSKMDIPIETASIVLKKIMGYYKRLNQYVFVLSQLYPAALYYDRITFMKRLIEENDVIYGSKLVRGGRLFIDPPIINYGKIKRETGVLMKIPNHTVAEYESIRKHYNAKLKEALRNLSGGKSE